MSRLNRLTSSVDAINMLQKGTYGVLSTASEEGKPYGIPLNYAYCHEENCIIFHCTKQGNKTDNISKNNKVSFTVVLNEKIIPENFTTHYESVVVEGTAHPILDLNEIKRYLLLLCEKLAPSNLSEAEKYIDKYIEHAAIYKININNITGKRNP